MDTDLVLRKESLPATIDELRDFVIVTKKRIEVHKVQIAAIERLGLSKSVYYRKLKETQYMSETVLHAEAKMGKLLQDIPSARGKGKRGKARLIGSTGGTNYTELQKTGIKKTDRMRAQILADNENTIEEVVEEEISKGNLPTREKVFKKIRENRTKKDREIMMRKGKLYKDEIFPVIHGDFYSYCMKNIKPNSIDHIITDPPYPRKFLPLWSQLGEVANRVLKPSGFCIVYTGVYYLPEVLNRLGEHLEYYWQMCMKLRGKHAVVFPRNIYQQYRSIIIFQKLPIKKQRFMTVDFFESDLHEEKALHPWQQAIAGFEVLLEKFTMPKQTILEPFAGAGTVGIACMKNNRKCILIEKDKNSVKIIKGRLNDTLKEMK